MKTREAQHTFALGDQVKFKDLPDEGTFTITKNTGHNLFNSEPCYSLRDSEGHALNRILESYITPA